MVELYVKLIIAKEKLLIRYQLSFRKKLGRSCWSLGITSMERRWNMETKVLAIEFED